MIDPQDEDALERWFGEVLARDAARRDVPGSPTRTVRYGSSPEQEADLWIPSSTDRPAVVVSLHGGYFMEPYRRALHLPITRELVARGFAVWNVEYRRAGSGGFRETTEDVWSAVDALLRIEALASPRVAVFGHSAGGYLAEWLASHPSVDLVVPLAPAVDLAAVVRAGWDRGAVVDWLKGRPDEDPDVFAATDLTRRLPAGVTRVLVHGTSDDVVGIEPTRDFARVASQAGDPTTLVELDGEGHYAYLDPREPAFQVLGRQLELWREHGHASSVSPSR